MSILCMILVFTAISRSASIEDVPFDEEQEHPLSDKYIEYINSVQSLWQAGRNFEADTPIEYLRQLNGVILNSDRSSIKANEFPGDVIQDLPESFDAREHWPHCPSISEIRNQGKCGSCWAMSSTEVMTDRTCIASQGKVQFHYSAFDLLTCCNYCCLYCLGGFPSEAWHYWIKTGIASGGNYDSKDKGCIPYPFPPTYSLEELEHIQLHDEKINLSCKNTCASADLDYNKDKHFGKSYHSLTDRNEDKIKTEIFNNGPVQATFEVFKDFFSYKSGVYRAVSNDSKGHHAVKMVGWGAEKGTKYWLIANSWGEQWGDHGFFKIVRGENHCKIENELYAGEPLL